MSYQVLARKYRSQSFDQMIGQNHISQTLLNALRNGRLPHALLFTGIRGTGKTSSARILAKSIRCPNAVNFVPCGHCHDCLEITAGKSLDVIEIDGASNNGVDSIRELRDSVIFSSSTGKYKVFIIDEVHMLSTSAFNALLKTLEEPPEHVIFIMATTEVQKIPQTILSRCQRFDFRRVTVKDLTAHLKWICEQEKIAIDEKALWLIARQGEGSVRDSLSLLDQVINFSKALSGETITSQMVSEILGLTERGLVLETFEGLLQRDAQSILDVIHKISKTSFNAVLFLEDVLRLFRHAILIKSSGSQIDYQQIDLPTEEISFLQTAVSDQGLTDLHALFDMTLKSLNDISRAQDQVLVLEVCLLRMANAPQFKDLNQLLQTGHVNNTSRKTVPSAPKHEEGSLVKATPQSSVQFSVAVQTETKEVVLKLPTADTWYAFVQKVKKENSFLGAKIENLAFVKCDTAIKKIYFQVSEIFSFIADQVKATEVQEQLSEACLSFFGEKYTVEVAKTKEKPTATAALKEQHQEIENHRAIEQSWLKDPKIKKAQDVFKGKARFIANKSGN